jgi:ABC-type transport system involved in multi-copper enzyme maturation permease subunit
VIAVIRSELLKIRTTAVPWVLAGVAILIEGLLILAIFLSRSQGGPGFDVPRTTQELRNLLGSGFQGYILALLLGVLMVTTEFRHKTVTTSFLVTPRRAVFVGGKLASAAIMGALLAVLMLVVALVGGGLTLNARGGSLSGLAHQIPAVVPGFVLVFVLFAILGVGVGSILTNQVAAIIVSLGWFIILQGILVALVNSAYKWVPTGAADAASNLTRGSRGGGPQLVIFHWWQGTLLMLLYGLGFALIGSLLLTRRDVT